MLALDPTDHACIDGRYIIEEHVAEGGMGQVYKARHASLGKIFALKVIAPAFADDHEARARFNQEAKLASQISHPGIVPVVDFGEDMTVGAYMVMELVEGAPVMPDDAPLTMRRALEILGQLADVLDHIHNRGVVHGDVKTDNVLVVTETDGPRRREVVRLLDFGLAQRMGAQCDHVDGTPQYLAPERIGGGPASVAADIYALGVLGFHLITGRYPFDGTVMETLMAQVNDEAPTLEAARGEPVDPAVERLIAHALAKDPNDRHTSAAQFRYEINAVMDMLALTRRRQRARSQHVAARRDMTINMLFDSSPLPQAVVSVEGHIDVANAAFAQLVGMEHAAVEGVAVTETALDACVPGLPELLRGVHESQRAIELRAQAPGTDDAPAIELDLWFAPFGEGVHVLVRVDES